MVEQELEDYIKTQTSLGVSQQAIRKSLLDAGYTEEEFRPLLEKHYAHGTKAGANAVLQSGGGKEIKSYHILWLNMAIVMVFASLFIYTTYDYNTKLTGMQEEHEQELSRIQEAMAEQGTQTARQINQMESGLESEIGIAQARIENVNEDLSKKIRDYNYQSMSRDQTLSSSIQKSSNRSLSELSSFAQQLEQFREASVDFSPVIQDSIESVVTIGSKGGGFFTTTGSGVVINNRGYVVTNYHVVDDLSRIDIKMHDGTDYTARMIGKDDSIDLAVLKLETNRDDFTYMTWADSEEVDVGDHVIAVGNPVGFDSTVTEGIISNTRRLVPGESEDIYYFQTDVAINAGNSGGPLINKEGKIVGIATLKYARIGFEGLSFALRSNDVKTRVLEILQQES